MNTGSLRDGWTVRSLESIAEEVVRRVPDPRTSGLDRFVSSSCIDRHDVRVARWESASEVISAAKRFESGDYLLVRRSLYATDFRERAPRADFAGVCSADILTIREREGEVATGFLQYLLYDKRLWDFIVANSTGSITRRIKWRQITKFEFALPPLDEQQRIVELLSTTDGAIQRYTRVADLTEFWIHSYFHRCVSRSSRARLGDVAAVDLGRQRAPKFDSGSNMLPYVRAANVKAGRLLLDDVLRMHFDQSEVARLKLRSGDVLVTEGCGSLAEIGANAVWNDEMTGDVCFQNTVLRLRTTSQQLDPGFLGLWAAQTFVAGGFAEIATGTSIYHLGAKRTADMQMPLPPVEQQRQIVRAVDAGRSATEGARASADRLRDLRRSLLSQLLNDGGSHVQ